MWENETVVLVTSLKKRILGGEPKARYTRIVSDNAIPPFIKAIFQQKVEEYLVTESPFGLKATPHFELRAEDLEGMRHRFLDLLREAAVFPANEVEEILREALVLRLDYLVKPADTMRRLLFGRQDRIEQGRLERILEPYAKLLPYAERLIQECRRLGYITLEVDEYGRLIGDIFHQMMNGESVKVVLRDFSVLLDFLSETKGEGVVRVDGDLLQEFLADRNLWNFRRALDIELKLGKEDFDAVELELTLRRYLEIRAAFTAETEKPPVMESPQKRDVAPPKPPEKGIFIKEKEEAPAPEEVGWELEEMIPKEPVSLEEEAAFPMVELTSEEPSDLLEPSEAPTQAEEPLIFTGEEPAVESPKEKKQPPNQMRIIRREKVIEEEPEMEPPEKPVVKKEATPGIGLKELIDERTEKVFIKKLFDGDRESYLALIEKLEEAESWRVAKILIDNELFKRDVDPFSREAIKLVDLVYSRYYPEESVGGAG